MLFARDGSWSKLGEKCNDLEKADVYMEGQVGQRWRKQVASRPDSVAITI